MQTPSAPSDGRPFDAVLCDLDGVIRFFDASVVARLEREAGLPEGTTAAVGFAPENDRPLLEGRITRRQWAESIVRGLPAALPRPRAEALAAAFTRADFRADPQVVALLRRLRRRCPLVLVTNATAWLDDDLRKMGITDLATSVVNSSELGIVKPDPRIYRIAAARAGVPLDRCLFVDDRSENVTAAVALGATGVVYRARTDLERALAPLLGEDEARTPAADR
ncbi:HAD-IA family hydrolase [Streptomyces sp. NPDC049906]|uniref:HAD-IA family hydrolase n=1 Tax=Streptomyces sp. NPDC049906 TaxID=3155656 RepID=UPI003447BE2B